MLDVNIQSHSHESASMPIDANAFSFAAPNAANSSGTTSPSAKTEDGIDIPFASFDDDLDHRKRRRNRTTQSCWSCHQAKRKCDRKRPCSRCIQLGLTGLCVYETDDPASRDDPTLTESQRLRKRIAELEALVREMKNKPHPRWADKVSSGNIGVDKWHTRAKYVVGGEGMDDYPYRFPDDGSLGPPFDDSRRMSVASSSQSSSSASPRTPLVYPHPAGHSHTHGHLASNPCSCLSTSPSTARALAHAIRSVVVDSGVGHPYAEGCKVLGLVRELEGEASPTSSSGSGSSNSHPNGWSNTHEPHSNNGSPQPSHPPTLTNGSNTSSPMTLPHASLLPSLPHSLAAQHHTTHQRLPYYTAHSYSYSDDLSRPSMPPISHSHSYSNGFTGVEYSSTKSFGLGVV